MESYSLADPTIVQKTVVYTEHGGISYSFKVNRDSTIKDVYDRVCQLVPSEILPAKFVLHSEQGKSMIYE
ncbi:hypothetical protein DPMN_018628 [Dreissena polymorpha]|uniref:Uncharacterized protein n=1 Tax=Dreissena polymorpha TaxID=45954 RepID=A0A9D4NGW9_DREPO|nr:hypothetical protein DPMN_018628 [Dreissena polymorpha]